MRAAIEHDGTMYVVGWGEGCGDCLLRKTTKPCNEHIFSQWCDQLDKISDRRAYLVSEEKA